MSRCAKLINLFTYYLHVVRNLDQNPEELWPNNLLRIPMHKHFLSWWQSVRFPHSEIKHTWFYGSWHTHEKKATWSIFSAVKSCWSLLTGDKHHWLKWKPAPKCFFQAQSHADSYLRQPFLTWVWMWRQTYFDFTVPEHHESCQWEKITYVLGCLTDIIPP